MPKKRKNTHNSVLNTLARKMDKYAVFNLRVWEFMWRNLTRHFPYYVLRKIFLSHPWHAFSGLSYYAKNVSAFKPDSLHGTLSFEKVVKHFSASDNPLIASGFCMKPYDTDVQQSICPAGQFNHRCYLLEQPAVLKAPEEWPPPCHRCGIAPLTVAAARIGADFYIMTSAFDIARDVFIPAAKGTGAQLGIFFLCPYSTEPFTFGLSISGMQGHLITFCQGDCRNHEEWTRADLGIKNKQTKVKASTYQKVLDSLQNTSERNKTFYTFHKVGEVYKPIKS